MLSLFVAILIGQSAVAPEDTKNLEPTIRPFVELQKLGRLKCVTVNEYRLQDEKKKEFIVRVHRFCYKGDYWTEAKYWESEFAKTKGWKVEQSAQKGLIVSKPVVHPKISEQTVLVHSGRIVFDVDATARTRVIADRTWVWVSLNETLKTKKW